MMLFGFGRVPGCLGLGALFFVWVGRDEWRDEHVNAHIGKRERYEKIKE